MFQSSPNPDTERRDASPMTQKAGNDPHDDRAASPEPLSVRKTVMAVIGNPPLEIGSIASRVRTHCRWQEYHLAQPKCRSGWL